MDQISGIKHPAFCDALALTRPAERQRTGCYLVETSNLVHQALRSPSEVVSVFALPAETAALAPECAARSVPLYVVGSGLLNKLVGTGYETAVMAAAVVRQRALAEEGLPAQGEALMLAGEEIQDPRNVGVLIRTAEAAGCAALLLSTNSAEPFSRAAVRSTTGSILRLPLCLCPDLAATLRRLRERGVTVVASSAHAPALAYSSALDRRPLVIVVGNETAGISPAVRAEASEFVALPMAPHGASSLNVTVAAGILLYEAVRQHL
ncbi:MAG TPA: RNA methyltransferase [Chthonomonadaceae bacterium]|nr:RNA methyltransferase [Chthonomonadaceae bacterium]